MTPAVIFDLDDTLIVDRAATAFALVSTARYAAAQFGIDGARVSRAALNWAHRLWRDGPYYESCERLGISALEGMWCQCEAVPQEFAAVELWFRRYQQSVWQLALADQVRNSAVGDAQQLLDCFVGERRRRGSAYREAASALVMLRQEGYRLAILTNGSSCLQRAKLDRSRLGPLVDVVVASSEIGFGKPDARAFRHVTDRLGVSIDCATMVGDDPIRDIAGARAAGLRAVWIMRQGPEPPGPAETSRIRNLTELTTELLRAN